MPIKDIFSANKTYISIPSMTNFPADPSKKCEIGVAVSIA